MTTIGTLEKVRELIYDRITRTCPYVNDEGIIHIITENLNDVHKATGEQPRDLLLEAKRILEFHRDYMGLGKSSQEQIDEFLTKVNKYLEDTYNGKK